MSFVGRYSLYKDQKAKLGNLLSGIGYPILIYFIFSLFYPLISIYPLYSFSWFLSLIVTLMMIERQLLRAISLYSVYGFRSVFYGTLFPPLIPIRILWGNLINFVATIRAYIQFSKKDDKKPKRVKEALTLEKSNGIDESAQPQGARERQLVWSKTEHDFLQNSVLERYHRKTGDILIEKGYIDPKTLKKALNNHPEEIPFSDYLIAEHMITENQMIDSLSTLKNEPYLFDASLKFYDVLKLSKGIKHFGWKKYLAIPLFKTDEATVFAYCKQSPSSLKEKLSAVCDSEIHLVLASFETIKEGLMIIGRKLENKTASIELEKQYNIEQVLLVRNYAALLKTSEENTSKIMGLSAADGEGQYALQETNP